MAVKSWPLNAETRSFPPIAEQGTSMRKLIIAGAMAAAISAPGFAQGMTINPGQWQYDTVMDMKMNMNGQAMDMPGQTISDTQCVTEADATLDPSQFTEPGCEVSGINQTSSSLSFTMTCNQQGMTMTGTMNAQVTDGGNGTTAKMVMQGEQPGMGTMNIDATITGKRIGDC